MLGKVVVLMHTSLSVEAMQGGGATDGVGSYNRTTTGETKGVHRSLRRGWHLLGCICSFYNTFL